MRPTKQELLKGTLDMLILQALTQGAMHGYGVARWIEEQTEGTLVIEEGSLYPALHRLERRGWIKARWGASKNNRRAKYYELTKTGRKQLEAELSAWRTLTAAVGQILETA